MEQKLLDFFTNYVLAPAGALVAYLGKTQLSRLSRIETKITEIDKHLAVITERLADLKEDFNDKRRR